MSVLKEPKYPMYLSASFLSTSCCISPGKLRKSLLFRLRLHVCVVVFIQERVFFPPSVTTLMIKTLKKGGPCLSSPYRSTPPPFPQQAISEFPRASELNEVECSTFDMETIFHSRANKTHFHKKGCAPNLILKVRVFGTRKWPIVSRPGDIFKISQGHVTNPCLVVWKSRNITGPMVLYFKAFQYPTTVILHFPSPPPR